MDYTKDIIRSYLLTCGPTGAPQAEKDAFKFKRYVIVTRAYTDAPPESGGAADGEDGKPGNSNQPASSKAKRKKV